MPSQALFTRVCALLGTSEEDGEWAAVDDVMCALNNGPRLCFFFLFFFPSGCGFYVCFKSATCPRCLWGFLSNLWSRAPPLESKVMPGQNTGEVYRKLNSLRCVVGPQVGLEPRAGGARTRDPVTDGFDNRLVGFQSFFLWFQLLKCWYFLVSFLCSDSKLNIFGPGWKQEGFGKH